MPTRKVGLKPLRTMRIARSIESRSSDSAVMKTFPSAGEGFGSVTGVILAYPRIASGCLPQQPLVDQHGRVTVVGRLLPGVRVTQQVAVLPWPRREFQSERQSARIDTAH